MAVFAAGALSRGVFLRGVLAPGTAHAAAGARSLVLLRLYGGNDGLNTVVPYAQGAYHDARPTLRVAPESVLALDDRIGLHPRMTRLREHHAAGRLAIIQGVGYPDASLSHFRSEVIWQSADPVGYPRTGWIGRWLDTQVAPGDPSVRGVDVSYYLDHAMLTSHANVFAFPSLDGLAFPTDFDYPEDADAKRRAFEAVSLAARAADSPARALASGGFVLSRNVDLYAAVPREPATVYPDTGVAGGLRSVAAMIAAADQGSIAAGVYHVGIDGFDTHSEQGNDDAHPQLLGELSDGIDAFHADLTQRGLADRVLVVAYSEFGRRVEENGSEGTDHGTAAPMFAFGDAVAGGIYGPEPDLADVDDDGNLRFAIDFRQVYATVLERWLGAESDPILGGSFEPVPFL